MANETVPASPKLLVPDAAEEVYRAYDASIKRIGKRNCRLAAHASAGFTAVTCNTADFNPADFNTADFSRGPGVSVEDRSSERVALRLTRRAIIS